MAKQRKSATEPVEDDAVVQGTLIEEEIAPQKGLTFEEEKVATAGDQSIPEQEREGRNEPTDSIVSEKELTTEERLLEVQFILAGIRASKDALLKEADEKVTAIQKQLAANLQEYDRLTQVYSEELSQLRKGAGTL